MGIKRIVDNGFWTDGKYDEFSPEDRYFMLYLLTGPYTTQLGIYEISLKYVPIHLGYTKDVVKVLLERFQNTYGIIYWSEETNEVAIKNYLKHSIIKGGTPVRDCLIKEMKKVKNKDLIAKVFAHIKDAENLNPTVKGIITEYEEKNGVLNYSNEKENDNENDNDNEVTCHVTANVTFKPEKIKPVKHKHGEYKNVLLTDDEMEKLQKEYPDYLDRIERLSSYVASTGKSYKSHYATIRNWARKDAEKPQVQKKNSFHNFHQRKYEADALERMALNTTPEHEKVENNPELKAKADALKKLLQEKY